MPKSPDSKDKTVLNEPFNTDRGYSGQEYDIEREREEGCKLPSGTVDPKAKGAVAKGTRGKIAPDKASARHSTPIPVRCMAAARLMGSVMAAKILPRTPENCKAPDAPRR